MTAAENDEVVGIRDDLRPARFTASGEPPMLQVSVRVQVGQEDDTALRRAAPAPFASSQAPFSVSIPSLNRRLKLYPSGDLQTTEWDLHRRPTRPLF